MTGTLHGYLVYRLQDGLKNKGFDISYDDISESLSNALLELDKDMKHNEDIELPTGNILKKKNYKGY